MGFMPDFEGLLVGILLIYSSLLSFIEISVPLFDVVVEHISL